MTHRLTHPFISFLIQAEDLALNLLIGAEAASFVSASVDSMARCRNWVRALKPPIAGKSGRGADGIDAGDQLSVRLVSVDVERAFIDYARLTVDGPGSDPCKAIC